MNGQQMSGAGAVSAALVLLVNKLAELGFTDAEMGVLVAGLASLVIFLVNRFLPPKPAAAEPPPESLLGGPEKPKEPA